VEQASIGQDNISFSTIQRAMVRHYLQRRPTLQSTVPDLGAWGTSKEGAIATQGVLGLPTTEGDRRGQRSLSSFQGAQEGKGAVVGSST
jgi:hypothetical protein